MLKAYTHASLERDSISKVCAIAIFYFDVLFPGYTGEFNKKETLKYSTCSYVKKWNDLDTHTRNMIKNRQFNCTL